MKEFRLPKEFGEKWIAALRSGEYKQGKGVLCKIDLFNSGLPPCYCAMGVAGKINDIPDNLMVDDGYFYESDLEGFYNEHNIPIPNELLMDNARDLLPETIVALNDNEELTFSQIADWIESNVELY